MKRDGRFTRKRTLGNKNYKWKGDEVGYSAVHSWIYRKLGKASECSNCHTKIDIQWANISGEYKRRVCDWKQLCIVCHRAFDGIAKLSKEQSLEIRNKYKSGLTQRPLAKEYGVTQMTISNIITNKTKYYA